MAQERHITPEKQLLKIIEDPNVKNAGLHAHTVKHRSRGLFSLGAWISRFFFFKDSIGRWSKDGGALQLNIKLINEILALCIFGLIFYLVTNISISFTRVKNMPDLAFEIPESAGLTTSTKAQILKTASFYSEKVRQRNIFEMGPKLTEEDAGEVFTRLPSSLILEATQHLKLVGISWSDDPDAMIEDTRALRTFFVKRGEMLGDVKVEAIFKDKVVLSYSGEEIELK